MKFYAIAKNENGADLIINSLPDSRIEAVNAAVRHCKKNNLNYQGIYLVKGTEKQGDVLTKMTNEKRGRKIVFW